jgi:RNA polymerase sigma-70 factor (ECF subfamily)
LAESDRQARFERTVLPHLNAAYNLARWLLRNEQDAEDMVQEAYLRAFTGFDGFRGEDGRAWLLAIVRNTCYSWLRKNRVQELMTVFEEETHSISVEHSDPESLQLKKADTEALRQALDRLPAEFREILILREMEGMSYKQIAAITEVPLGTVMSRLTRARRRLQYCLTGRER